MKQIYVVIIILLFVSLNLRSQTTVTVEKTEDERFIAQVDASKTDIQLLDRSNLVKELTLGIEWWTLLKEPVEKYLFRWKKGSSVWSQKHMISINEKNLGRYPDLLKKFQGLKPSFIEIQIDVWLDFGDNYAQKNQQFFKSLPDCLGSSRYAQISGKTFYEMKSNYGHRTIDSKVKFLISKAGATGNDLVPGSPKDWSEFIQFGTCTVDDETGYQIFKHAQKATFMLKILDIEVPQERIDKLAEAYLKKEKGEEEEGDDWTNDDDNTNNWDEMADQDENSWDQGSSSDDSWGEMEEEENIEYKIKSKDGKYAVIGTNGKIYVPYTKYPISSYDEYSQTAFFSEYVPLNLSYKKECWFYKLSYFPKREGYVDKHGKLAIPPVKKAEISIFWDKPSIKLVEYGARNNDGPSKAELRQRKERCRRELKEETKKLRNILESKGFEVYIND